MGYANYCDDPHIRELQREIGQWSDYNFGNVDTGPAGLVEEVAELYEAMGGDLRPRNLARILLRPVAKMCRAWVKRQQGIRGTPEQWKEETRKEAADVAIKLMQICHDEGIDLQTAIIERWKVVGSRDFRANPLGHGMPGASG